MPLIAKGTSTATKRQAPESIDESVTPRLRRYVLPEPRDRFEAEYVPNFPSAGTLAGEFARYIDLVIEHRSGAMAVVDELAFLGSQLEDPALADHPKRGWAERRERRLLLEQTLRLNTMLIQTYYAQGLWNFFSPEQRVELGLTTLVGIGPEDDFGVLVPSIRTGPIQEAAPLPDDWKWSADFIRNMLPELLDMSGLCPF